MYGIYGKYNIMVYIITITISISFILEDIFQVTL